MRKSFIKGLRLKILYRLGWHTNRIRIFNTYLHGIKWKIPVIDGIGYGNAYGIETEPWIFDTIKQIYNSGKINVFVDVGVNTGQTLIKVKSIDPEIKYYGFEPNTSCIFYVDYLRRLNKLKNVNLVCAALGNRNELLELRYEGLDDTRATLLDSFNSFSGALYTRKVPVFSMDYVGFEFDEQSNILVKIDVEGYELEVLQGAENFLKSARPKLIFEVLPHHNDGTLLSKQTLLFELLKSHNYIVLSLNDGQKPSLVSLGFNNQDNYSKCDYLAIPVQNSNVEFTG